MIDNLPTPPKPNLEQFDKEQAERRAKAPKSNKYQKAHVVIRETDGIDNLSYFQKEDRAEALAAVGRFAEAAMLDTPKTEFYLKAAKAVWEDVDCDCPQTFAKDGKSYDPHFVVREIFSEKLGREARLIGCNRCDLLKVA